MNHRTAEIVQLLAEGSKLTLSGLAQHFNVSERTIRNDIASLNDSLLHAGRAGVTLERSGAIVCPEDPSHLLTEDIPLDTSNYQPTPAERVSLACIHILCTDKPTTIAEVAEKLHISRNTLVKSLPEIRTKVSEAGLTFRSQASKGITIKGDERSKRHLLLQLFLDLKESPAATLLPIQLDLDKEKRDSIDAILSQQEEQWGCVLTGYAHHHVLSYLCIAQMRSSKGMQITQAQHSDSILHDMACNIWISIVQMYKLEHDEAEIDTLADLLEKQRYIRRDLQPSSAPKVQLLTKILIERLSDELGINLNDDFIFFENLSNHLESVLKPDPVEYPDTPLVREVVQQNKPIVDAVRACDDIVRSHIHRELTDLEIGYIALHVCAAIERKKEQNPDLRIILASNAGVGTSQLLIQELRHRFNIQISSTVTAHEAEKLSPTDADLVISTVPLESCAVGWTQVSPLLKETDQLKLSQTIDLLRSAQSLSATASKSRNNTEPSAQGVVSTIAPIVYDLDSSHAPQLMRAIRRAVNSYFAEDTQHTDNPSSPAAHDFLRPSHIRLDVACSDWREAIRESARVLVRGGYIEPRYVDACIKNVEENGPYIVLCPGFAMPHEGIDQGSLEVGFSLIRLAKPINFGSEENDPVEFVCCFSAVDHKKHLHAFFNLINMMRKPGVRESLREATTPDEAALILQMEEIGLSK